MGHHDQPEMTGAISPMTSASFDGPPALEIDHVGHRYGARTALHDVSLAVKPSSFTVLLGLNGAGKSTLFSLITRLYAIRAGQNSHPGSRRRARAGRGLEQARGGVSIARPRCRHFGSAKPALSRGAAWNRQRAGGRTDQSRPGSRCDDGSAGRARQQSFGRSDAPGGNRPRLAARPEATAAG